MTEESVEVLEYIGFIPDVARLICDRYCNRPSPTLVFCSDPRRYDTSLRKMLYAASYLRRAAKKWLTPHLDETTGHCEFESFEAFISALKAAFDDPDPAATADRKLRSRRQGNDSVATYYSKFILASILEWNDQAERSQFRTGLKDEVKRLLIGRASSDTFEQFVNDVIGLDNDLRAFDLDKKNVRNGPSSPQVLPPVPTATIANVSKGKSNVDHRRQWDQESRDCEPEPEQEATHRRQHDDSCEREQEQGQAGRAGAYLQRPAGACHGIAVDSPDTDAGGVRNVFIEDGLVAMATAYHKGFYVTNDAKIIHRYLPREIGELVVWYLWLVAVYDFRVVGGIKALVIGGGHGDEAKTSTGLQQRETAFGGPRESRTGDVGNRVKETIANADQASEDITHGI